MIVVLVLHIISLLCLLQSSAAAPSLALPGCRDVCGNVSIPYPFGFGKEHCYHNKSFEITCNIESGKTPKPFLSRFNLEVLNISNIMREGQYEREGQFVMVNVPVAPICKGSPWTSPNLTESPFRFSSSNSFIVMGCSNALLSNQSGAVVGGCTRGQFVETSIPSALAIYIITTDAATENCTYSFLSYSAQSPILENFSNSSTPVLLEWMISLDNLHGPRNSNRYCFEETSTDGRTAHYCQCSSTYEGNPYIPNGCQVVEVCRGCKGTCIQDNTRINGTDYVYYCDNRKSLKAVILGVSISGGSLFILLGSFWLYTIIMRKVRRKEMFFKRNGGLLLQQQMKSDKGVVEKTRIFTSQELKKATDNFNNNRILDQGGQGTVYKGMLTDGEIIAIKKSKIVDESQLEHFINEVVILSQINHRNVVKLLGCCLETEVPLLVYEFIPNGTLFELIHDPNEVFPLSWEMRLQIATEVTGVCHTPFLSP